MMTILAVSDSIGETAYIVAKAAACQFDEKVHIKRMPYIMKLEDAEYVLKEAMKCEKVIIVSTVITVDVREYLTQRTLELNISIINILGPIINLISSMLRIQPLYNPGALRHTDEDYYKRIEAIEFAIQYDDSKDFRGLKNADVILIGLSRTSKTPLCMYLANKGIKAINIPLMPEVKLPDEIFEVDRRKIFGLIIDPLKLIEIRKKRMNKFHRISNEIEYAGDERVLAEFEYSDKIMKKIGCKTIDVTERAIEDTAMIILNSINTEYST